MDRRTKILGAVFIALVGVALLAGGCTEQQRAKNWGGTATIDLPRQEPNLVALPCDRHELLARRDMRAGDRVETYEFSENSSWCFMEGTVVIKEIPAASTPRREACLLYTSPSPRDRTRSRMPSSA